ncbi:LysM peptidoglycan-binding domain-containing protein [Massilia sp. METH4]|uniref:LysM peptidoglycan-binding domain-containing protein n=1 Tax=Massilia sp. METH4 TaxID=3123041 RepID=UPI0030CF8926
MKSVEALKTEARRQTKYEQWQNTIDEAINDSRWHRYDCDIRRTVNIFNSHLSGNGYTSLDWQYVKAMIWTESGGPDNPAWRENPMQIGNEGDPGLRALLVGNEGGELIMPTSLRQRLTIASVTTNLRHNIEAGVAYLLMRHARYDIQTVKDANDKRIHSVMVKAGDSLDRIARKNDTTVEILKTSNGAHVFLRPGQTLQYQKAALRKVIIGWELITPASIAKRYNVGDPSYSRKISYCLEVIRRSKVGGETCD